MVVQVVLISQNGNPAPCATKAQVGPQHPGCGSSLVKEELEKDRIGLAVEKVVKIVIEVKW